MGETEGIDAVILCIVIGVPIAVICYKLEPYVNEFFAIDWARIGINTGIIVLYLTALFFIGWHIYKKRKGRKEEEELEREELEREEKELKEKLKKSFYSISCSLVLEYVEELRLFLGEIPKYLVEKHQKDIKNFYKNAQKRLDEIQLKKEQEEEEERQKEREYQNRLKEGERKEQLKKLKIEDLFRFKKRRNSIKALPLDEEYDYDVIEEAEGLMRGHKEYQKERQRIRKEAQEYYMSHDLDTKPSLDEELEEEVYSQIRKEIQIGKIKVFNKKGVKKKLKGVFYRAQGLDQEAKQSALNQGFQHMRGVELNGSFCGGGFYILKEKPSETDYHFCMKHLFSELHSEMKVEKNIGGKRVDVALKLNNLKLGIEIETGKNKVEQVRRKVMWLNKHFDHWVIVCPRDKVKKYRFLVDGQKSFCLTPKYGKEKVLELINSYGAAIKHS